MPSKIAAPSNANCRRYSTLYCPYVYYEDTGEVPHNRANVVNLPGRRPDQAKDGAKDGAKTWT
ncbi:MAG: hypothetical protein WA879_08350 [Candidatus Acidiferrales bacterium]